MLRRLSPLALVLLATACSSRASTESTDASVSAPSVTSESTLTALRRSMLAAPALDGVRTAIFPPSAATGLSRRGDRIVADVPGARAHLELPTAAHGALSLTSRGVSITVRARGAAAVEGVVDDNSLVYRNAFPHADLVHIPLVDGDEELVVLHEPPKERELSWELGLGEGAAGLRLVGGTLEVLDKSGLPRLHVGEPTVFDADGQGVRATLEVVGCAVDRSPTIPTDHPVVHSGAERCTVVARFDDAGLRYPLVFDPAWTSTASMAKARSEHQMVPFKTSSGTCAAGCPMVLGGKDSSSTVLRTTEIYLPSDIWLAQPSFVNARYSFAAVPFGYDRIAIAGGATTTTPTTTASVEVYNITAGTWASAGTLPGGARMGISGASVTGSNGANGFLFLTYAQAIFVGGWDGTSVFSNKVDSLTDGDTSTTTGVTLAAATSLGTARAFASVGGYDAGCGIVVGCNSKRYFAVAGGRGSGGAVASIEALGGTFAVAPSETTAVPFPSPWVSGGNLGTARWSGAKVVNGSQMWIGGGWSGVGVGASEVSRILITTGAPTSIGNFATARGAGAAGIVPFTAGSFPVFTGGSQALGTSHGSALVDVANTTGVFAASSMIGSRLEHTAAALPSGKLLVAGGYRANCTSFGCTVPTPQFLSTAELFAPSDNGATCTAAGDCKSTNCVDGVCCDSACNSQCQACNLPTKVGTCTTVTKTNGPTSYPAGQAVTGFGTTRTLCSPFGEPCGYACDGTSATACSLASPRPICIAASCTGGVQTNPSTCDSAGLCPTPSTPTKDCTPYACGATACRATCSDNSHCATGYKCSGGACVTAGTAGAACSVTGDCGSGLTCVDSVCCSSSTCPSGMKCNNTEAPGVCRYPNGSTCTTGGAALCASGNCIDGYCCNSTCTGQCQACDVPGKLGVCTAVAGDVHGSRTKCTGSGSCQAKCDGVNGFTCGAPPGVTTVCAGAFCTASAETPTRFCDGLGACPSAASKPCKEYKCGTTACLASCSTTTDCATGYTCIGGSCVTTGALGTSCSADDQCTSAHCVDGVCCSTGSCPSGQRCDATSTGTCAGPIASACTADSQCGSGFCVDGFCCGTKCDGQCEACNVAKSEGTCLAVAGKPRGVRVACSGAGACQASCDGTVRTSCATVPGSSTTCAAASCDVATGIAKPAAYCDGAGNCTPAKASTCKPYVCDSTACKTVCIAETDCATGYTCKDNACVPKAGVACTMDGDCTSGHCVDGVCCNTACSGQCEACDIPGSIGTCSPTLGAPHGSRTKCSDGAGNVCKALACDGSDRAKCVGYANGPDTVCQTPACSDGTLKPEGACDGKGTCKVGETTSCAPYVCDGTTKCKVTCATSSDCATGFLCSSGKCSAITSKCSDDGLSSVPLDGKPSQPCNGFVCDPSSGKCRDTCTASTECASGFTCDGSKCQPSATPPGGDTGEDGGCAVQSTGHTDNASYLFAVAGLALLGLARRRRGF